MLLGREAFDDLGALLISSLLNVISVDSCRRALSSVVFADRHSTPAPEAMLTKASVTIFLSFAVSPN